MHIWKNAKSLALVGAVFALATSALSAAVPVDRSVYTITARHSGLVIEVVDAGTGNGANVQQATWADVDHQRWRLNNLGSGNWRISPFHRTSAALRQSRDNAEMRSYANEPTRHWKLVDVGDGYFNIVAAGSPTECLAVADASTEHGANVVVQPIESGAAHQQFKFEPTVGEKGRSSEVSSASGAVSQPVAVARPVAPPVAKPVLSPAEKAKLDQFLSMRWTNIATRMPDEWYGSEQAKSVAENVLNYQTKIGGWAKNSGYHNDSIKQEEWKRIQASGVGATFDNDATLTEMKFLAKVYAKNPDERYRAAFMRAFDYIFAAQYPNGGWPQYFPYRTKKSAYSSHITYNDDVMVLVLRFLDSIVKQDPLFASLGITPEMRAKAKTAFDKGIDCILETQVVIDGLPTVWCAQHNEFTLVPEGAREYELPSLSGGESVGVVLLLMDLEKPSPRVVNAVNGAVKWFEDHKITGIRVVDVKGEGVPTPMAGVDGAKLSIDADPAPDRVVVKDASAPPLWGRFHDLETGEAFFCDRDAIKKKSLAEIGINRRGGYNWYNNGPSAVLAKYPEWTKKHGVKPGQVTRVENKERAELLAMLIRDEKERQKTLTPGVRPAYVPPVGTKYSPVMQSAPAANGPLTGLAKLEADLGLNPDQQARVEAYLFELNEQRRVIKADAATRPGDEIDARMKALNASYLGKGGKIHALMTDEQFEKWEKLQVARRLARGK